MPTPTVCKKQLGNELRHLREAAGLKQDDACKVIHKTQGRLAEIENGKRGVSPSELTLLLQEYNVTDQAHIDYLMELRRNSNQRGRWSGYRGIHPDRFRQYVDLEEDAELIRTVETEVPPGLLQCERFIRALYTSQRDLSPEEVEDGVQARLLRQRILHRDNPPRAMFIMSESCLCRSYGGPGVMREQIDHMIELSRRPNILIQVVPFSTESNVSASLGFRFVLLRIPSPGNAGPLEFAYVEGVDDNRYLDDKKAVVAHDTLWSRLAAAALGPDATREFMRRAADRYH